MSNVVLLDTYFLNFAVIINEMIGRVAERYTRSVQNAVPERDWRFKSSLAHQI